MTKTQTQKEKPKPAAADGARVGGKLLDGDGVKSATMAQGEKRKRGRPRIHPLPDPNAPKRRRGRPRKEVSEYRELACKVCGHVVSSRKWAKCPLPNCPTHNDVVVVGKKPPRGSKLPAEMVFGDKPPAVLPPRFGETPPPIGMGGKEPVDILAPPPVGECDIPPEFVVDDNKDEGDGKPRAYCATCDYLVTFREWCECEHAGCTTESAPPVLWKEAGYVVVPRGHPFGGASAEGALPTADNPPSPPVVKRKYKADSTIDENGNLKLGTLASAPMTYADRLSVLAESLVLLLAPSARRKAIMAIYRAAQSFDFSNESTEKADAFYVLADELKKRSDLS